MLALILCSTAPLVSAVGLPTPSARQLAFQKRELQLFMHFGVNTFTDREWGLGDEDPNIFQPARLNTSQWTEVAMSGGFQEAILVAKHHDGFALFPHPYSNHTVASSSWRGGKGDVVKDFVASCAASGVLPSVYLSPWDRNQYNMTWDPKYNAFYEQTLSWLMSRYGSFSQLWWDGANGGGTPPSVYSWKSFLRIMRALQPGAVAGGCGGGDETCKSDCGPDTRWIGNEKGVGLETSWSTACGSIEFFPENSTDQVWNPSFVDVSIRPGWFYHPAEDSKIKSLAELVEIYFQSVGRNSVLQLNVPPNRDGLIAPGDASRVAEFGSWVRKSFSDDLLRSEGVLATASTERSDTLDAGAALLESEGVWWEPTTASSASLTIQLPKSVEANTVLLQEHVALGQRVTNHTIEVRASPGSPWQQVVSMTTIGYKRLHRFLEDGGSLKVQALRLTVEATVQSLPAQIQRVGMFRVEDVPSV